MFDLLFTAGKRDSDMVGAAAAEVIAGHDRNTLFLEERFSKVQGGVDRIASGGGFAKVGGDIREDVERALGFDAGDVGKLGDDSMNQLCTSGERLTHSFDIICALRKSGADCRIYK